MDAGFLIRGFIELSLLAAILLRVRHLIYKTNLKFVFSSLKNRARSSVGTLRACFGGLFLSGREGL